MKKLKLVSVGVFALLSVCLNANEISPKESLGQALFLDKNLSKNRRFLHRHKYTSSKNMIFDLQEQELSTPTLLIDKATPK